MYEDKFKNIDGIDKLLVKNFEDIISKTIERERQRHPQVSIENILQEITDIDKQMMNIVYLKKDQINLIDLEKYLKDKFEQDSEILKSEKQSIRTNLRRLIRIYDYLKGESKKPLIKATFIRTPLEVFSFYENNSTRLLYKSHPIILLSNAIIHSC